MSFESSFGAASADMMAAAMGIFFMVIWLVAIAFSVVSYVLFSRGMQVIARRRGIRKSWLAWVPVANMWTLGSISDQYQYVVKGKIRNRRKVLLGLMIGYVAIFVLLEVITAFFFGEENVAVFALLFLAALGIFAVAVLYMVFLYIALYDLYVSCDPENAVLYLVLSILLNVTLPFFLLACRNKDGGMPQRKPVQPAAPVMPEPPAEEVREEAEAPAEEVSEEAPEEVPEEAAPAEASLPVEEARELPEEE